MVPCWVCWWRCCYERGQGGFGGRDSLGLSPGPLVVKGCGPGAFDTSQAGLPQCDGLSANSELPMGDPSQPEIVMVEMAIMMTIITIVAIASIFYWYFYFWYYYF